MSVIAMFLLTIASMFYFLCGETRYVTFELEPFPLADWRLRQTLALP